MLLKVDQTDRQVDLRGDDWMQTPLGDPRGYIDAHELRELWFHTGTACNLACPFCLEGSKPGDTRLGLIRFEDAKPLIDEALELGVEQFSFTGGEPFVAREIVRILEYAAKFRPCLVLTNATDPVLRRLKQIAPLANTPHPISFRVSLDAPDAERHDEGRGVGNFDKALAGIVELTKLGFNVSIARHMADGEDGAAVDAQYHAIFRDLGIAEDPHIVAFPEFHAPGSIVDVPHITEGCMTTHQTEADRKAYMCAFSKMVVKKDGQMRVYACTLVDDDPSYDLGGTLREARGERVMLRHHRCYSCFAFGASCSEVG